MTSATELTERGTSKTVQARGIKIHYHDVGKGEPLLFLHSYGPGTTAWITWHKNLAVLSQHYRCIAMDLVNYGRTGPLVYHEPVHAVHARTALALLDALGIEKATLIGNSVGGTTALVFAINYPERVNRLVVGACHASTGGDPYVVANFPSEGSRATREAYANPTRENFRRYLRVHLDDEALVTEELLDYIYTNHMEHPDHDEARRQSVSVPHSNLPDLPKIKVPTLIVHGRFDRMVTVEQGLTIMGYIPTARLVVLNKCGHWPPYEHPHEYTTHVLNFLKNL